MNPDDLRLQAPLPQPSRDPVDPRLLDDLKPVRPAPAVRPLTLRLLIVTALLLAAGAFLLGADGVRAMSPAQLAFYVLLLTAGTSAFASLSAIESSPTAPRGFGPRTGAIVYFAVLACGFTPLFQWRPELDLPMRECVLLTLSGGVFALVASWSLLHRGFFVRPMAAGFACASLAAVTGFSVIQTLCPYMESGHIFFAHILPSAGFAFLGAAAMSSFLRWKNRA